MQMKRLIAVMLAVLMMLTLAACGSSGNSESSENSEQNSSAPAEEEESSVPGDAEKTGDGVLILYFSAAHTTGSDAVSQATPMGDKDGSVGWIANVIQKETGGEVAQIIPEDPYPTGYNDTADQAKKEADSDARPKLKDLGVDPAEYSTIFIGYPIWWYQMPMAMYTFFDTYDLSGKTIIPFNTHEGSGDGGTYDDIKELEPDAEVLEGLAISGGDTGTSEAEKEVKDWLAGLNI